MLIMDREPKLLKKLPNVSRVVPLIFLCEDGFTLTPVLIVPICFLLSWFFIGTETVALALILLFQGGLYECQA